MVVLNKSYVNAQKRNYFEFSESTKQAAANRQDGRCACCGKDLVRQMKKHISIEAHHLMPCQCGEVGDSADKQYLTSADNCVWLCGECHIDIGHGGNFMSGGIPEPRHYAETFPYAFGKKSSGDFGAWESKTTQDYNRIMKKIRIKRLTSPL